MNKFYLSATACLLALTASAQNFTKVTGGIAANSFTSWGVSWQDYDNDGDLDLFVNDKDQHRLFRNDGSGVFTNITPTNLASPAPLGFYYTTAWGDYNNDGYLDLYMGNDGDKHALFRGGAGGAFTQITTGPQSNDMVHSFANVSFVDYDRDGFLDIFCSNVKNAQSVAEKNTLYKGNGSSFTKITTGPVVTDLDDNWCHAWADYNNDRCPDLFVGNMTNDFLYKNNCDGTFTKVTTGPVVSDGKDSESASWGDYDNDGFLDLFVGIWGDHCRLYHNNGDGTFSLKTGTPLDANTDNVTGSGWADYDNDGFLDLYVCCWSANGTAKNRLYHNVAGTFTEVTGNVLTATPHASNSCLWADVDNDGDMDLYVANKSTANEFFRNDGNGNKWVAFRLTGSVSNRSAIGAKVRVKAIIDGTPVWQVREVGGISGQFTQSPMVANFGLYLTGSADSVIVQWPSGADCVFTNVAAGKTYVISEDGCGKVQLSVPSVASISGGQAYPNPFASATYIPYTLTQKSDVSIDVFDLTGRKVISIVNREQVPGGYEALITGEQLAAGGTYLYQLTAGDQVIKGKIVYHGE